MGGLGASVLRVYFSGVSGLCVCKPSSYYRAGRAIFGSWEIFWALGLCAQMLSAVHYTVVLGGFYSIGFRGYGA